MIIIFHVDCYCMCSGAQNELAQFLKKETFLCGFAIVLMMVMFFFLDNQQKCTLFWLWFPTIHLPPPYFPFFSKFHICLLSISLSFCFVFSPILFFWPNFFLHNSNYIYTNIWKTSINQTLINRQSHAHTHTVVQFIISQNMLLLGNSNKWKTKKKFWLFRLNRFHLDRETHTTKWANKKKNQIIWYMCLCVVRLSPN